MEVYGIGTDIVEIDRVKDAMERTPTFKIRVFTEREIAYVEKKKIENRQRQSSSRDCSFKQREKR